MTHTNQRYDVRGDVIKTGRSPECAVQIPPELGASVSRVHAEIVFQDGGVMIRDAGSRNGTFVNSTQISEAQAARKGDVVMLGPGGPSFTIEELRIVKAEEIAAKPIPARDAAKAASPTPLQEPDTEPSEGNSFVSKLVKSVGRVFGKS